MGILLKILPILFSEISHFAIMALGKEAIHEMRDMIATACFQGV